MQTYLQTIGLRPHQIALGRDRCCASRRASGRGTTDNLFRSQVVTWASPLACTSDQFRSSWRSDPNHIPRMQTGPSLQQRALAGYHYPSYPRAANLCFWQNWPWLLLFIHTQQPPSSQPLCPSGRTQRRWYHRWTQKLLLWEGQQKGHRAGPDLPPIPKPSEPGLQSEDVEKKWQGATLPDRPLENERLRTLPVHLHDYPRVVVHHANSSAELRFESGSLQNRHQKRMVNPIEDFRLI